jgi:hypothetical protein
VGEAEEGKATLNIPRKDAIATPFIIPASVETKLLLD